MASRSCFARSRDDGVVAKLIDAEVSFRPQRLVAPLQLSSGTIEKLTQVVASVVVESRGQRSSGCGSTYLSDLWAWPDDSLSHDHRDGVLRRFCQTIARELPTYFRSEAWHPIEIGLRIHDLVCHKLTFTPSPPTLARAMCGSSFDAAVHDAVGRALGVSAFSLYDNNAVVPSADSYFPETGTCRAIAKVIQRPKYELPAWYLVSKDDSLAITLVPAIRKCGFRCFKLKLSGRDNRADAERTVEVYRAAKTTEVDSPRLTIDTNEANPSADSVLEYLEELKSRSGEAYAALEYVEQPTSRDIRRNPFDWTRVVKHKPVMLDEGLTDLDVMDEARRQGYSGWALKTCKGHSMLLCTAAWAYRHKMLISLQDLTNPGIALIQAALTGAHLPTINGAELNSPQFTPAANAEFVGRLPDLFEPRNGIHRLPPDFKPVGLGSADPLYK